MSFTNGTLDGIVRGTSPLMLNSEMSFSMMHFVVVLFVADLFEYLGIALDMDSSVDFDGTDVVEFGMEQREVVLGGVGLTFGPSFETTRVSSCSVSLKNAHLCCHIHFLALYLSFHTPVHMNQFHFLVSLDLIV